MPDEPRHVRAGERGETTERRHLAGEEAGAEGRLVDDLDDDRRPVAELSAPHLAVAQRAQPRGDGGRADDLADALPVLDAGSAVGALDDEQVGMRERDEDGKGLVQRRLGSLPVAEQ